MNPFRVTWLGCILFLFCGILGFAQATISLSTPAFNKGAAIPDAYALHGQNISPGLKIESVPANARTLVLIVDDPDSPSGLWTHWLVWNWPASVTFVEDGKLPAQAVQGKNSFGHVRYDGPVPPSGTHRYFFHLFALDTMLPLPVGSTRDTLLAAMKNHVVGSGETYGVYSASH